MTDEAKKEMLSRSRSGEVVKVSVDAITFRQSKAERPLSRKNARHANSLFVKFREQDLEKFAAGFTGRPMLRDHDRDDLLKRGGTITNSRIVETPKEFQLMQTMELVKPWAVEAVLDGTLETFSIGWDPPSGGRSAALSAITCTVCNSAMFVSNCPHMPGDEHKVASSGEIVIVEAEFKNPRGTEVSGVSFPAVQGTQVENVREALSQKKIKPHGKMPRMNPETLKRLGLPPDASQDQIDSKVDALAAKGVKSTELETKLKAAELSAAENAKAIAEMKLEEKAKTQIQNETRLAAAKTKAIATGLWAPGSEREALFDEFAALGVDKAERYAASLNPVTPVGQPLTARTMSKADDFSATPIGMVLSATYMAGSVQVAEAESTFRKLRITPEAFAKYGPHAWECRDPDSAWLDDGAGSLTGMEVH
jgi:hypothetical protein